MEDKDKKKRKNKSIWWKRILRILGWITLSLIVLFISIVLFVRSPWGQNIIVGKLTNYISAKTHTKVSIKKLFITFSGDINLQGLHLEDQKGDTLIYSEKLQVEIPLWPIIWGNPISIDNLQWTGLRANIVRKDTIEGFNFQFLIDAFTSDTTTTKTDEPSNEPPKIFIGSIELSDFDLNFDDAVSGTKANIELGKFHVEGKNFDLKKMKFQVSEMSLQNTKANYVQTKASPPSDASETTLPYLGLYNLKIKNVIVHYNSEVDSIEADFNLADLELKVPKADLALQDILVSNFILNNSSIQIKSNAQKKAITKPESKPTTPESIEPFIWPNWNINVESIDLQNNHLHYQVGEIPQEMDTFNPDYIDLTDFNFIATDIVLSKNKSAKFHLKNFTFHESSGLTLKKLAFSTMVDSTVFSVDDLVLITGNSIINADLKTQFATIQQFIEKPEDSDLTMDLKHFIIDINDLFEFQPELRGNEYLKKLAKYKFSGQINANGTISKLNLTEFLVNWGQNTSIKTHGELINLTDFDKFIANIDNFTFYSTQSDLANFVSEKDLGISIPKTILIESQLKGKLDDFQTKIQLTIPEGKIKIDGQFKQQDEISFSADVEAIDLKLGEILNNPDIGTIAFEIKAKGNGKNMNDLNAQLVSDFSKLEFNGYDFSALKLDGELNEGKGFITLKYQDENLDLIVDSRIQLDSISPKISANINLNGADLYALGLTEKQIKTQLIINANFKGNAEIFDFDSHFSEGVAIYDEKTFYLGTVDLTANATKDSTALDISSDFLNGKIRANAGIDNITTAIQHHLTGYFSDYVEHADSFSNPVQLKMDMTFSETKLITDFLVPDIKTMDPLNINVDFNQKKKTLKANINLPYIDYANKTIDSLQMDFNSTEKEAKFKLGFAKINAEPFVMNRTFFDGDLKNGILNLNFNAFDGEKETYFVRTEISGKISNLKIHFDPNKLIFQGETWSIPADNQISIHDKKITAQNFVLSRNGQSIKIANDLMETTPNNIGIGFKNFKLDNLLTLFNKDNLLASGDLQGNIVVVNPLEKFGLIADFSIENLTALKTPLGKLTLKAKSKNGNNYNLDLGLIGDDIDLAIKGDYNSQNISSGLNFNLDLNKIGMKTIANLTGESLQDASGEISGEMVIQGNANSPKYEGYLQFKDAVFNISQLNSKFRLSNDKIKIDNAYITLNHFSIEDEQNNTFTINGSISTEKLSDPEFDLSVNGQNFQALNSTKEDNDLYYGKVNFDMDGTIKGKLSFPKIDLNIGINENTDFTYAIPESQAKLEKRDGIVEFVNKEDPDNILTRTDDSTFIANFSGIELHARLIIDKGAAFNVIIDPNTQDDLRISGVGALDFNIAKNGRMTLSGRYDINDGHYNLSLYNLVKRKFELEAGSSVTWRGDLMDADLSVTAKYSLETSASALMASQTSGASEEVKNKYRQTLPFFVFLTVKGELDQPELEFRLDMPEDSRGAIDGTVYARIKQLNSEEDELSKQVFSLLVLKKFYPNSGSDGSNGGAASIVRKNVNQVLSDQLNAFSAKLMGNTGVELDFELNSFTDYQGESVQQRTDLNVSAQKKLLDDRLIVQVGSNVNVEGDAHPGEENPVVGNASIQYLLTKDGRWRLKGFRNNEYENVIDGQVFVNGISLIFQRQFNKWRDILVAPPIEKELNEDTKVDKTTEKKDKKYKTDNKS
ncbi:MAG: translocation/assembly module TamB domain-containing protein [Bacteroidales bacterium]|nr:translocation/assembly module TamB domain-containing protein [Bacteroidales bacterium]